MSDLELTREHSVAMSEKGWSDSELAFGWLERYDREMSEKAHGNWRLVYYEWHSHYTCNNPICTHQQDSHCLLAAAFITCPATSRSFHIWATQIGSPRRAQRG